MDTIRPHPARMYDYYLGGHDNYEVDRDAAERVIAVFPVMRQAARENRAFLSRAVRTLVAEYGIRQLIDIGTGIPTSPNTHEIAQGAAQYTRVVYADNDPMVGVHAQGRLVGAGQTAFVQGDVRDPESILKDPATRELIDFSQPVGLLMVALLHFVTDDDDPVGIVTHLRDALPAGSFLVLTHASRDGAAVEQLEPIAELLDVYQSASAALTPRPGAEIHRLFDGFDLLDPGLVSVAEWRPDQVTTPPWVGLLGGVGRKR